jgi:hypothetical protein
MQSTTTADLSCEEIHAGFDALIKRIAEIAAVRDVALQIASQATKDLVRARGEHEAELKSRDEEARARLDLRDNVISLLRIAGDAKDNKIRQLTAQLREPAAADEGRRRQSEAVQQQPEAPAMWRRFLQRLGNRKDHP